MLIAEDDIQDINQILLAETGIFISPDKKNLVELRLSSRIKELGFIDLQDYLAYLKMNNQERLIFFNLLTTNYTNFCRESYHFEILIKELIPQILKTKDEISIWSAGCSSGEEAYTIAILLNHFFANKLNFNILGTDINTEVLRAAKTGIYTQEEINRLKPEYLFNNFQQGVGKYEGYYRVKAQLRENIKFEHLNLNKFAREGIKKKFDVIFCRNVLIYFSESNRKRVIAQFNQSLTKPGFLILGHSENINLAKAENNSIWEKIARNSYQKI